MTELNGYHLYPDITITSTLSLAVSLLDDYTDKQPLGRLNVFLEGNGMNLKSIRNLSNYYLFLDLFDSAGDYRIRVEAEYYFALDEPVTLPLENPMEPVVQLRLIPKPCYPFSSGVTLIRGMVRDTGGNPAPGAQVKVVGKEVHNKTTDNGEFVLYFKGLTADHLIQNRFVKGNADDTIYLKAVHGERRGRRKLNKVEEGKTTVPGKPIRIKKNE